MIDGLATVWVPVEDMNRAIGFYTDSLGLEVTNHDGDWAEVSTGSVTIGLNAHEGEGAGAAGGPVIAFKPEDGIEEAVAGLKDKGSPEVAFRVAVKDGKVNFTARGMRGIGKK